MYANDGSDNALAKDILAVINGALARGANWLYDDTKLEAFVRTRFPPEPYMGPPGFRLLMEDAWSQRLQRVRNALLLLPVQAQTDTFVCVSENHDSERYESLQVKAELNLKQFGVSIIRVTTQNFLRNNSTAIERFEDVLPSARVPMGDFPDGSGRRELHGMLSAFEVFAKDMVVKPAKEFGERITAIRRIPAGDRHYSVRIPLRQATAA